ncbi:ribonuclease H-like domain, reverse transcriptase, RNA-dependent DNA polymerase [Tanacetum coccineum]|uniref:Ribonuclease H-like domain, reverse transcriptase, RNA-dependent DNA polymerase n=1 Tax=Tanacetum coccineum TaxID=301880 RepID=A0ABQ5B5Q3_9ASTR
MTTLKFADTHNMVAFLSKPAESEGFEQIVDFLNAHTIKYALTINPTIYTSCIEQFWATVKAKTVNGEVQLQALVDGKKITITESIVRRDLQLEDAEGVDCLPNATIFKQLTLMEYEKISQKLTFYKAFFSPQWKFLIHTILQCISLRLKHGIEFSSTMASTIICLPTNQKFNFSKYIFESMVKNLDNVGKFLMYLRPKKKDTKVPQPSGPTTNVVDEAVNEEMDDSLERDATTATSLDAEQASGNINKTQSKATLNEPSSIETSSSSGPRHQETMRDIIAQTRRVESSDEEGLGEEDASKQGRIADIDANKDIYLVNVHTDEDMFGVNDLDGDEVIVDNVDVVKTAEETRSVVEEVTTVIEKAKLVSAAEETVNAAATTVSTASTIPVSRTKTLLSEKEAIFLLLTGIGDDIYSTVDACKTANEMWIAIKRLQQDSSSARPSASTRHKGKEITKPVTPPSESVSEEDSDPDNELRCGKDIQIMARPCKYFKRLYKPYQPTPSELLQNSRKKQAEIPHQGKGYRGNGLWEMVKGRLGSVLGGWFGARNRGRGWFEVWREGVEMRSCLETKLPVLLHRTGVFASKGIDPNSYSIKFSQEQNVPQQGGLFGDCGVFVCLFLYRLAHGIPLAVEDPIQMALAYREKMVKFYFEHKIICPS